MGTMLIFLILKLSLLLDPSSRLCGKFEWTFGDTKVSFGGK
jgi:hypothetical protein